jgi:hypothetical protein
MPRLILILAMGALFAPLGATAADLSPAFRNTIVSTYPDGERCSLWLDPDGRYTGLGRRRQHTSGVWTVRGDTVCFRQQRPFPVPFSYCTKMVRGGVGTAWWANAVTGERIHIELVAGRPFPVQSLPGARSGE